MVNVVGFAFSLLFQVSVMGWLGLSIYNLIHGYLVSTRLEDGLAAINITDICAICGTQCPVCGAEPAAPLECIPQPTTLQSNEGASTSMATTTGAQPNEGASTSMVMTTGAQGVTRRAGTEGGNTVSTEVTTMATTGSTSTTTVTPCVTEQARGTGELVMCRYSCCPGGCHRHRRPYRNVEPEDPKEDMVWV